MPTVMEAVNIIIMSVMLALVIVILVLGAVNNRLTADVKSQYSRGKSTFFVPRGSQEYPAWNPQSNNLVIPGSEQTASAAPVVAPAAPTVIVNDAGASGQVVTIPDEAVTDTVDKIPDPEAGQLDMTQRMTGAASTYAAVKRRH